MSWLERVEEEPQKSWQNDTEAYHRYSTREYWREREKEEVERYGDPFRCTVTRPTPRPAGPHSKPRVSTRGEFYPRTTYYREPDDDRWIPCRPDEWGGEGLNKGET